MKLIPADAQIVPYDGSVTATPPSTPGDYYQAPPVVGLHIVWSPSPPSSTGFYEVQSP